MEGWGYNNRAQGMRQEQLADQRQKYHIRIRRELRDDQPIKNMRMAFICQHSGMEAFQEELVRFTTILQKQKIQYREILEILKTINHSDFIRYVNKPFIQKLIYVSIRLINEQQQIRSKLNQLFIDTPLLVQILEEILKAVTNISKFQDEDIWPYLEIILFFVQNYPMQTEVISNIAAIKDWGDKSSLAEQFCKVFNKIVYKKPFPSNKDIAITNSFCNQLLSQNTYFEFIRMINQYLGTNINNGIETADLCQAFSALSRITRRKHKKDRLVKQEIIESQYIRKQTVKLLEISKSPQVLIRINTFLSHLFVSYHQAQTFLQKEPILFTVLMNLLLKTKLGEDVKESTCFSICQCLSAQNISNSNYQQLCQKLTYLQYNFRGSPRIMKQFMYIYLIMMKTLDYQRAENCLHRYPSYLTTCMESEDPDIKKRIVQVAEKIVKEEVQEDRENRVAATTILIQQCSILQYLETIIEHSQLALREAAEAVMERLIQITREEGANTYL